MRLADLHWDLIAGGHWWHAKFTRPDLSVVSVERPSAKNGQYPVGRYWFYDHNRNVTFARSLDLLEAQCLLISLTTEGNDAAP
jgi:hypothetical protein